MTLSRIKKFFSALLLMMTTLTMQAITLQTDSFQPFKIIGKSFICPDLKGDNKSPSISIHDAPKNTQSFVLLVHDVDAPHLAGFVHWVVYIDNPNMTQLPEGLTPSSDNGVTFGLNGLGKNSYLGPCPPQGSGLHRYNFVLYALDTKLDPKSVSQMDQKAIIEKIYTHIIDHTVLVGLYKAKP